MTHIAVKPHPDLDPKAWPRIVHPASGSLLDANKQVPPDGRPWLYDGFTCRMLTDGAILRADDPLFAERDAEAEKAEAVEPPATVLDPAH